MKILIFMLIIYLSMMFVFMNHPISMGLIVLIQTFLICVKIFMITSTSWFSYMMFLMFIGGLLILFIYISSVASNENFFLKVKLSLLMLISTFILVSLIDKFYLFSIYFNNLSSCSYPNYFEILSLLKLYNTKSCLMTIFLSIYLFILMIVVNLICWLTDGPLRSKN